MTQKIDMRAQREKRDLVQKVKVQLKKEFVGLDRLIDEIMAIVEPWLCFHQYQVRPTITNIWGLTGTGKTSLIKRMIVLLNCKNVAFHFDMGSSSYDYSPDAILTAAKDKEAANILIFDEFQHFKSRDPHGFDFDRNRYNFLWELFDTGLVHVRQSTYGNDLSQKVRDLKFALEANVEIKEGKVVRGEKTFLDILGSSDKWSHSYGSSVDSDPIYVIDPIEYHQIIELDPVRFPTQLHVQKYVRKLDGPRTLDFLMDLEAKSRQPQILNCKQSLIINIGNLDEAYTFSGEYSQAFSADAFYALSQKISLLDIKTALKKRFRDEQIARLGNNHVLFPALTEASFYEIIHIELQRLAELFSEQRGVKLYFGNSIAKLLYQVGVYPSQGTRPLYSSINNMMGSALPSLHQWLSEEALASTEEVHVSYSSEKMDFRAYANGALLGTTSQSINHFKTKSRIDQELLVVTCVHEAAHVLTNVLCYNEAPFMVQSINPEGNVEGVCHRQDQRINQHNLRKELMVLLAGMAGEEIVFGEQHTTNGSSNDLNKASMLAVSSISAWGFGESLLSFYLLQDSQHYSSTITQHMHHLADELIGSAKKEVLGLLQDHAPALKSLATALLKKGRLESQEIVDSLKPFDLHPIATTYLEPSPSHVYQEQFQQFLM